VLNSFIKELIYQSDKFIVYLDETLAVQYRGFFNFPAGSSEICFELARLETLTLGMSRKDPRLLAMRRLIAEVFAKLHMSPDLVIPAACLAKADKVISDIILTHTRVKRVIFSAVVTGITGFFGWLWIISHGTNAGISAENEFGLWIPLGAIGALLFSFTRMHVMEVKLFSNNWLLFVESAARILTGAIGALILVAAAKSNLILGVLSQATSDAHAFWGLVTLSILAGASERLVPEFITRMDGSSSGAGSSKAVAPKPASAHSHPQKR